MEAAESKGAAAMAEKGKDCSYCGSPINANAILCPICKNYQSAWRNHLTFVAGLTGFITLLAGAALFVAQQAEQVYTSLFWRNTLTVLAFEGGARAGVSKITVSNSGDGPLLLSKVEVHWKNGSQEFRFDKAVPVNALETIEEKSQRPNANQGGTYEFGIMGSQTGYATQELFDLAGRPANPKCVNVLFYNKEHSNFIRMKEHYLNVAKLHVIAGEAKAVVFFFGGRRATEIKAELPVVAIFESSVRPECREVIAKALAMAPVE